MLLLIYKPQRMRDNLQFNMFRDIFGIFSRIGRGQNDKRTKAQAQLIKSYCFIDDMGAQPWHNK